MENTLENGKLIAVYGSLLVGLHNHSVISQHGKDSYKLLGEDVIRDNFTLISLHDSFPGLIPNTDKDIPVKIEVYRVNEAVYQSVERLEGYPSFYDKHLVDTKFGQAEVYVLGEEYLSYPIVESGDWKGYLENLR